MVSEYRMSLGVLFHCASLFAHLIAKKMIKKNPSVKCDKRCGGWGGGGGGGGKRSGGRGLLMGFLWCRGENISATGGC